MCHLRLWLGWSLLHLIFPHSCPDSEMLHFEICFKMHRTCMYVCVNLLVTNPRHYLLFSIFSSCHIILIIVSCNMMHRLSNMSKQDSLSIKHQYTVGSSRYKLAFFFYLPLTEKCWSFVKRASNCFSVIRLWWPLIWTSTSGWSVVQQIHTRSIRWTLMHEHEHTHAYKYMKIPFFFIATLYNL